MFESVSQPVLVTFTPTRGQKVCPLSASSVECSVLHLYTHKQKRTNTIIVFSCSRLGLFYFKTYGKVLLELIRQKTKKCGGRH